MKVLIVGGGVGGLVCAQKLAGSHDRNKLEIQVVDRSLKQDFAPSFLWIMTGTRRPKRIARSLGGLVGRGITVTEAEVTAIDVQASKASTSAGEIAFDQLVLAPGARLLPESVPGLEEAGHTPYTPTGAESLRDRLAGFSGGRVLVAVAAMPYKCPAAPYETAFLVEDLLRRRGVTAKVDVITPEPFPMPVAGKAVGGQVTAMLKARGIGFDPNRKLESVDPGAKEARYADGNEPFDLLIYVPPHGAPEFVAHSSIAGPAGWIPVDRGKLSVTEGVHAIGDVTAVALENGMFLPKAGVFAHAEAEVVATNLASRAAGRPETASFDGRGMCFLETGAGRAGFASGQFFAEPNPSVAMRRPARHWHWGKVLFERRWLSRLPRWEGT